jgi:hypothetical protein
MTRRSPLFSGASAVTATATDGQGTTGFVPGRAATQKNSVPYRDVAASLIALQHRAARVGLTELESKTLLAIVSLTVPWSKLVDRTSARQVAGLVYGCDPDDLTGAQRSRIGDAMRNLDAKRLVRCRTGRGRYAMTLVQIPLIRWGSNDPPAHAIDVHVADASRTTDDQWPPATDSTTPSNELNDPPQRDTTERFTENPSPRNSFAHSDRLIERLARHFVPRFSDLDCEYLIVRLREENIGDAIIDAAIGQAIAKDAHSLKYVETVARDWFSQVGAA